MNIERATLTDAGALAWTASLAFSSASKRPLPKVRAVFGYARHLVYLLPAALEGSLWHSNRRMTIGISGMEGQHSRRRTWVMVTTIALFLAAVGSLVFVIPGTRQEAEQLVAVLNGVMIALACVFVVGVVAIVRSRPIRHFKAFSAVGAWKKELHPEQVYEIVYLAKHPEETEGAGFRFAKAALSELVPAGSRLCTIARTERHIRAYRAAGFRQLPYKGKLTAGMAGVMPDSWTALSSSPS
jgi:hypothetical protein